jgi:hypothetical protein
MPRKDKNGDWLDYKDRPTPQRFIEKTVKRRERAIDKMFGGAENISSRMLQLKLKVVKTFDDYLNYLAEQNDASWMSNSKGNISLTNFDHTRQVVRKNATRIEYDENINLAKQVADDFLREQSKGAPANLRVLVNEAFEVDKKGRVSPDRIEWLARIQIKHAKWQKFQELVAKSRAIAGSKVYYTLRHRETATDEWQTIKLAFGNVDNAEA